jgi:carbamoyl-phosphate synthase large subunit
LNVLITSAGRRVSLVKYFIAEVRGRLGRDARVFTTDLTPETSPACHASDRAFAVGRFNDPSYVSNLLELCLHHKVKLVVPTLDTELLLLAESRLAFQAEGIEIVISDVSLIRECRNKRLTTELFRKNKCEVPPFIDIERPTFPMFIKPISGSSSQELSVIRDRGMLSEYLMNTDRFMHMQYLSPDEFAEFTVDMYFDRNQILRTAVPRMRLAVRGGEMSKGVTRKGKVLDYVLNRFSELSGARGCITLQLFCSNDEEQFYGIEINPRFGGGHPLSYLAGANFVGSLIDEYLLHKEVRTTNDWEADLLLLRYDEEMTVRGFGTA